MEVDEVIRPTPTTVSKEAQEVIAKTTIQNASEIKADFGPDDLEEARRTYKNFDRAYKDEVFETYSAEIATLRKIETNEANTDVHLITPNTLNEATEGFALMWIHGGGFTLGAPDDVVWAGVPIACLTGIRTYSVGYRLAPEHPYPAGLNDCLAVYEDLVKQYDPKKVGIFGASAGGNLAVAVVLKAREKHYPLPGCVVAISPWADLTKTGDSYLTLDGKDPVLQTYERIEWCVKAYANSKLLKDPLISPVYADFDSFPPTLITTGTRDLFLSNCVRLWRSMEDRGVDAKLSVWEGMWHGFNYNRDLPEGDKADHEIADFFRENFKVP